MFRKAGAVVAQTQKAKKVIEQDFLKAVILGKIDDVQKCIRQGVNVNIIEQEHDSFTALHILAEKGDILIGKELMAQKTLNINAQTKFGNTPLILAVASNMLDFVKLILRCGANPNIANYAGTMPLLVAVRRNYHMVVELLAHNATINVVDCFGDTPLSMCIIEFPSEIIAKYLLRNGADPNLRATKELPVLLELCLERTTRLQFQLVTLLLDFHADPNITNTISKQTALHMCSITGSVMLTRLLIKRGANPKAKDLLNRTPLDLAIEHEHHDLISFYKHKKVKIISPKESASKAILKDRSSHIRIGPRLLNKGSSKSVKFNEAEVTESDEEEDFNLF